MKHDITTKMVDVDGNPFEIYMCGNQKSDKLALFLHGFPETAHSWRHQMPLLADMGYKCWAPNQRGYGKSYMPGKVSDYHTDLLLQDVVGFIKASKCKSVTLIGHDWGGVIAWNYAMEKKLPLNKLVIMNIPHMAIFLKELLGKWRQIKKSWYMNFFQIPKLPEYLLTRNKGEAFLKVFDKSLYRQGKFTPDDIEIYRQNILRPGGLTAMLNWYRSTMRHFYSGRKRINLLSQEKIKVPTLMIWGEQDVALDIHTTLGTDQYVENLTLRYITDAGHFVQEEAPEEVNAMLKAWLEDKEVPGEKESQTLRLSPK
jgi:pimeloyl-ACP methyl ester carboxylesterase